MSHDVVVAVGSNIDPGRHVPLALQCMTQAFEVTSAASIEATEPVGPPGQPEYWNTAVRIRTELDHPALKQRLRSIEAELGRARQGDRYAPRTVDLDEIWRNGAITDADVHARPFLQHFLNQLGIVYDATLHA